MNIRISSGTKMLKSYSNLVPSSPMTHLKGKFKLEFFISIMKPIISFVYKVAMKTETNKAYLFSLPFS